MAKKRDLSRLQTVLIKKTLASTREQAKKLARKMGYRTYTIRETKNTWRLRQRPLECFRKTGYGTNCFDKGGVKRGVCLVFATPKKGAKRRKACR